MRRTNKKGFTIVELVIVIAVIAILAAVLIPTFASLVEKANVSTDTQLVKNLNTALASDTKKHTTMAEALEAAAEFGYDVAKINASATGNEILWDSVNDLFCYLNDGKIEYIPDYNPGQTVADVDYWQICNDTAKIGSYSIYWNGADEQTIEGLIVGFDAGQTKGHTITFTGTKADIYTNGGTLTVNNDNAEVNHYGFAGKVDIQACKDASYHEFGQVVEMTVTKGHVEIEKGALVSNISSVAGTGASVTNEKGGHIITVPGNSGISTGDSTSFALEIGTAAELASFHDSVNNGMSYEGLTVKLTADIDLSGYANWTPIGNRYTMREGKVVDFGENSDRVFKGTFDGQGHTISGMYINSLAENYQGLRDWRTDAKVEKSSYAALFGYICDATLKNFTVGGSVVGVDVAGVVGITNGTCTIENVTSNVSLVGKIGSNSENHNRAKVAGFVCCPKGKALTIKNCTNNGDIQTTEMAGGFVAYMGVAGTLTLENCTNNGNVTVTSAKDAQTAPAGGLVAVVQAGNGCEVTAILNGCKNTGAVSSSLEAGAIVGRVSIGTDATNCTVTLTLDETCSNTATITSTANKVSNPATNQLVGFFDNAGTGNITGGQTINYN